MKRAVLFKKLKSGRVQCTACSHYCKIAEGKTGICGVRKNIKGTLNLLVYGKAIALNVDPIEKKPLYHFLPGSSILSLGTFGCNFKCDFCQNWDISQRTKEYKNQKTKELKNQEAIEVFGWGQNLPPKDIVNTAIRNKIPSIAYTYNEPAVFIEYALDTAKLAHKAGLKNVFVSNGYQSPESRKLIMPYLDAINIDLKSFDNNFYQKICGATLKPVLESIIYYHTNKVHLEITTLVIPSQNDTSENLKQIANFIASVDKNIPWHISRFFPKYKMNRIEITPESTLKRAYKIGKRAKLKYVYIGNI